MHTRRLRYVLPLVELVLLPALASAQGTEAPPTAINQFACPLVPTLSDGPDWRGAGQSRSSAMALGPKSADHANGSSEEPCDCGPFIGGTHNIDERTEGSLVRRAAREADGDTEDVWEVFPAQMGQHQAFLSFNQSYADIAERDPRTTLFRVRLEFMRPSPQGFPADDEFPGLRSVEDLLRAVVVSAGGIQVGRLTVNGHREFYFYVAFQDESAQSILTSVGSQTPYKLRYIHEFDPKKEGYWKYLYPTDDDWQVIRDMRVLDALRKEGDVANRRRHVSHWAYFSTRENAEQFVGWAKANSYELDLVAPAVGNKTVVRFGHEGTVELADISHHTIAINRKVRELGGDYDGWETKVERGR